MPDKEPTQEQKKEFWEWCGFEFWKPIENGAYDILYPDGSLCLGRMLEVDLNNLFKYAVPRLGIYPKVELYKEDIQDKPYWKCNLSWAREGYSGRKTSGEVIAEDPALALFWAIWEVIKDAR